MATYIAKRTGFIGRRVREGETFEWNGKKGDWMEEVGDALDAIGSLFDAADTVADVVAISESRVRTMPSEPVVRRTRQPRKK